MSLRAGLGGGGYREITSVQSEGGFGVEICQKKEKRVRVKKAMEGGRGGLN